MKFTCSRDDLVNKVSIVQRAVTANSTVNILNGILIEASDDNKIKLTDDELIKTIEELIDNPKMREKMEENSAGFYSEDVRKNIYNEICALLKK